MVRYEDDQLEETRTLLRHDGLDQLLSVFQQGVYHLTSVQGYFGIKSDGYIRPNDGSFPDTYPQSAISYGRDRGYVSLFDFESPTEIQILQQYWKWEGFIFRHKPATILIGFDRQKLASELIYYKQATEEAGVKPMKIPHLEVWYPKPISFRWATQFVLITSQRSVEFEVFEVERETSKRLKPLLKIARALDAQNGAESKLQKFLRSKRREEHP
jgi:hypothetical protein